MSAVDGAERGGRKQVQERVQARMNSPLDMREVRLRGLHGGVLRAVIGPAAWRVSRG